jgi:hypothetical protein
MIWSFIRGAVAAATAATATVAATTASVASGNWLRVEGCDSEGDHRLTEPVQPAIFDDLIHRPDADSG